MNNEITKLQTEMTELQQLRAATNSDSIANMLDNQIEGIKKRLAELNPQSNLADAIEQAVNKRVDDCTPAAVFEDMHPAVAIKAINGAALSVINHLIYTNSRHEAIMARQAMQVTATSGWKTRAIENTSPYASEEDQLLEIEEHTKSCVASLAQLLCDFDHTVSRAVRESVLLDVSGTEGHRAGYDDFPSVAAAIRRREAKAQEAAVARRAKGAVVKALVPNVVSLLN